MKKICSNIDLKNFLESSMNERYEFGKIIENSSGFNISVKIKVMSSVLNYSTIFLNDFKITASFIYNSEEKKELEKKWLTCVYNKSKELDDNYINDYTEYMSAKYQDMLKKDVESLKNKIGAN